jgi:hypothetical protein
LFIFSPLPVIRAGTVYFLLPIGNIIPQTGDPRRYGLFLALAIVFPVFLFWFFWFARFFFFSPFQLAEYNFKRCTLLLIIRAV